MTFPQWEKMSIGVGVGQPSTNHKEEGIGDGEEEDVYINDCRV